MKKGNKLVKILVGILIFIGIAYVGVVGYFVNKIEVYPRATLESVWNSPTLMDKYMIERHKTPADYGFEYKEYSYNSSGNIKLYGWFIPSKDKASKKIMVITHGRGVNRLKPMKFLELVKETGLDAEYNVFLPDLRNSGKSTISRTQMGYCFSEDVYNTIKFLNQELGMKEFVIQSFSMSGMGTSIMLWRKDLMDDLNKRGVVIKKVILDSPLSNVVEITKINAQNMHVPKFIIDSTFFVFNFRVNGKLEQLRLSELLKDVNIPILVFDSVDDVQTPYYILLKELDKLSSKDNIRIKIFEKGGHVLTYKYPANKEEYTKLEYDFIKN